MRTQSINILILIVISALFVNAGCGGKKSSDSKPNKPKSRTYVLATGQKGGIYDLLGKGIKAAVENLYPGEINIKIEDSNGSIENLEWLEEKFEQERLNEEGKLESEQNNRKPKVADLAFAQNDIADWVCRGEKIRALPSKRISGVASLYTEFVQLVVRKDVNIREIKDLNKRKRVRTHSDPNVISSTAIDILKAVGLYTVDVDIQTLDYKDTVLGLKNGNIDAAFFIAGAPTPIVEDLWREEVIRFIEIPWDEARQARKSCPYFVYDSIPEGTYNRGRGDGQVKNKEVATLALRALLVARSNFDPKDIYRITAAILDPGRMAEAVQSDPNIDSAKKERIQEIAKKIDIRHAKQGMTIDLHPGAEQYFKEVSIWRRLRAYRPEAVLVVVACFSAVCFLLLLKHNRLLPRLIPSSINGSIRRRIPRDICRRAWKLAPSRTLTRIHQLVPKNILRFVLEPIPWDILKRTVRPITRNVYFQVGVGFLCLYIISAVIMVFCEREANSKFASLPLSIWSLVVWISSGFEEHQPVTLPGRITSIFILLVLSVGFGGAVTGRFAAFFMKKERKMRPNIKNHIVICNWNQRGQKVVEQLHKKEAAPHIDIAIVTDRDVDEEELRKKDPKTYDNVYFQKGLPDSLSVLESCRIHMAKSVIIIADDECCGADKPRDPDDKSADIALAIGMKLKEKLGVDDSGKLREPRPHIIAEVLNRERVGKLKAVGVDETVCAAELRLGVIAQCALHHNLSVMYNELLDYSGKTNEIYVVVDKDKRKIPGICVNKTFEECAEIINKHRCARSQNPVILLGVYRDDKIILNPRKKGKKKEEVNIERIEDKDGFVVMAFSPPNLDYLRVKGPKAILGGLE